MSTVLFPFDKILDLHSSQKIVLVPIVHTFQNAMGCWSVVGNGDVARSEDIC